MPSPARYGQRPVYFSDLAVLSDAPYQRIHLPPGQQGDAIGLLRTHFNVH